MTNLSGLDVKIQRFNFFTAAKEFIKPIFDKPENTIPADQVKISSLNDRKIRLQSPLALFSRPGQPAGGSDTIPRALAQAGEIAYQKHKRIAGDCEATANDLHKILLGKKSLSVRYLPQAKGLNENGQPLTYLKTLIDTNKLKPGMVIFINTVPSMSMRNLKPSDRHWFTYMGKDPNTNLPVFHDQYGTNRSLNDMLRLKNVKNPDVPERSERKLHTIFDPYENNREQLFGA